jgi:choline-sulfatase
MHFVGPDQLHGFEERLTTDIYPADFGWTPDYRKPGERIDWWYHNLGSVTGRRRGRDHQPVEYDDDVAFQAVQKLYDLSRGQDPRPWCLTVSFTHPHDPFVARRKYWDLYEDCPRMRAARPLAYDDMDPHSQAPDGRLRLARPGRSPPTMSAAPRQGYFANISYIDDKIGEILAVLEATRQEAIIVFLSDHGEMLGERGLWFKMNFFEGSARVPLMIAAPGCPPGRSTPGLDHRPDADACALAGHLDGRGDALDRRREPDPGGKRRPAHPPVAMEYAAEGTITPMVALRDGAWKYIRCPPTRHAVRRGERPRRTATNLATDPRAAEILPFPGWPTTLGPGRL